MDHKETHCEFCGEDFILGEVHSCKPKPPSTGPMPRILWIENRIEAVTGYMLRCMQQGFWNQADEAFAELNILFSERHLTEINK